MIVHAPRDKPIDMTLRLWSEWVLLKPLLDQADVTVELLHIVGEPMATEGRLAGRVADRHYASTVSFRGKDDNDVSAWLTRIIGLIESGQDLVVYLLSGQIEAVLWITVLADGVTPLPNIDPHILAACRRLGLKLLLESYNDFDEGGVPLKVWLTEPQGTGLVSNSEHASAWN